MANRFTDSEKYKDPWFGNLQPKYKALYLYMLDTCDLAGFWKANFNLFKFFWGFEMSHGDMGNFDGRVIKIDDETYFITEFIKFQYKNLSETSNVYKGVLKCFNNHKLQINPYLTLNQGLPNPRLTHRDRDRDMDRDNINNIKLSKSNLTKKSDVVQNDFDYTHPLDLPVDQPKQKKFKPDLEKLYADYPRKEGKKKAFEKLNKLITSEEIFTQVHTAIKNYAKQSADKETRYVKQFSSFVSVWEDYLVVAEKKLSDFTEDEALAYFEEKLSTPGAFGFGRDHV